MENVMHYAFKVSCAVFFIGYVVYLIAAATREKFFADLWGNWYVLSSVVLVIFASIGNSNSTGKVRIPVCCLFVSVWSMAIMFAVGKESSLHGAAKALFVLFYSISVSMFGYAFFEA